MASYHLPNPNQEFDLSGTAGNIIAAVGDADTITATTPDGVWGDPITNQPAGPSNETIDLGGNTILHLQDGLQLTVAGVNLTAADV